MADLVLSLEILFRRPHLLSWSFFFLWNFYSQKVYCSCSSNWNNDECSHFFHFAGESNHTFLKNHHFLCWILRSLFQNFWSNSWRILEQRDDVIKIAHLENYNSSTIQMDNHCHNFLLDKLLHSISCCPFWESFQRICWPVKKVPSNQKVIREEPY